MVERVDAALTRDVMVAVKRYAERRCRFLRMHGVRVDSDLADHLVADAIADTVSGELRWDSQSCELVTHLRWAIRARTRDLLEHEQKFPRESRDWNLDAGEREMHAPGRTPEEVSVVRDLASKLRAALTAAAESEGDQIVVRLLAAYEDGLTNRREVSAHLGVEQQEYDNARRRLARLIAGLPPTLREDAMDTLRSKQ